MSSGRRSFLRAACRRGIWVLHSRISGRSFKWRQSMNRRISIVAVVLIVAGVFTVRGVFSQPTPQASRKVIKLAGGPISGAFSAGILAGNTMYLAGGIGIYAETGKVSEKIEDQIKVLRAGAKEGPDEAGMTLDELGWV